MKLGRLTASLFNNQALIIALLVMPIVSLFADEDLTKLSHDVPIKNFSNSSVLQAEISNGNEKHLKNQIKSRVGNHFIPYIELGITGIKNFSCRTKSVIAGDLFLPFFSGQNNQVVFLNLRTLDPSGSAFAGNAGLGYRKLFIHSNDSNEDQKHLIGIYGSFDRTRTVYRQYFNQLTVGLEYWQNKLFVGTNIYSPIGTKKRLIAEKQTFTDTSLITDKLYEEVGRGFDAVLGCSLSENLTGYAGGFYFKGYESNKIVRGAKVQLEYSFPSAPETILRVFDNARLNVGVKKTFISRGTEAFIELKFRIGLSPTAIKLSAFESHLIDMVKREQQVITVINQVQDVKNISPANPDLLPTSSEPPLGKRLLKETKNSGNPDSEEALPAEANKGTQVSENSGDPNTLTGGENERTNLNQPNRQLTNNHNEGTNPPATDQPPADGNVADNHNALETQAQDNVAGNQNDLHQDTHPRSENQPSGDTEEFNENFGSKDLSSSVIGNEKAIQVRSTSWFPDWVNVKTAANAAVVGSAVVATHLITTHVVHSLVNSAMLSKIAPAASSLAPALINMAALTNGPTNLPMLTDMASSATTLLNNAGITQSVRDPLGNAGGNTVLSRVAEVTTSNILSGMTNAFSAADHGRIWLRHLTGCEIHADPEALQRLSEKLVQEAHSLTGASKNG
jgi:hypothetical protein